MGQIKENKVEIMETIRKYGEMPINPERSAFLADCWAAYNALCMICGENEADYEGAAPLTKSQVMCWVASMENADGTCGGNWTMEQTEHVREKYGLDCDPLMFFAAMNMMYSDYCKVAEKFGTITPDFYACMAKAFLDDEDAKSHKLARYYHSIAEK